MTDPSLAAQKILAVIESQDGDSDLAVATAVLRAVVDQVAPEWEPPSWEYLLVMGHWQESDRIRRQLLSIAAELEAQQ